MRQMVWRRIVEIERQIDTRSLHIDVIIAGQDGERNRRIAAGKVAQHGYQPALSDRRPGVDRQRAGQRLVFDVQDLLIQGVEGRF